MEVFARRGIFCPGGFGQAHRLSPQLRIDFILLTFFVRFPRAYMTGLLAIYSNDNSRLCAIAGFLRSGMIIAHSNFYENASGKVAGQGRSGQR